MAKREKRGAQRLDGGTEVEVKEGDISDVSVMVVAEKLKSMRKKLQKDEGNTLQLDDKLAVDAGRVGAEERSGKR